MAGLAYGLPHFCRIPRRCADYPMNSRSRLATLAMVLMDRDQQSLLALNGLTSYRHLKEDLPTVLEVLYPMELK